MRTIHFYLFCIFSLLCLNAQAEERVPFNEWLEGVKEEALSQNISEPTVKAVLKNAKYLPSVITLDRSQPEFITPFLTYLEKRSTPNLVAQGKQLLMAHQTPLREIEARYGVPPHVLLAFWGLETNYGKNKGNYGTPSALLSLAYDGRRSAFFRTQLLDAMRIVDAGHSNVAGLRGSWAGAMGHMQFMPSTLLKYGVDADSDGRINIVSSLDDAFASAANYLSQVGWRKGELAAIEVKLPAHFDYKEAQINHRKTSAEWLKMGVVSATEVQIPVQNNAAILLPQGWQGPAFMVFSNFDVVMDWNRSVNYALSVSYLAGQLVDAPSLVGGEGADRTALSFNQIWALQAKLNALGFDCGIPDGFPGLKTQVAIRQYQTSQKLPPDGYASPSLYMRLVSESPQ